jgi:hypothetical protein
VQKLSTGVYAWDNSLKEPSETINQSDTLVFLLNLLTHFLIDNRGLTISFPGLAASLNSRVTGKTAVRRMADTYFNLNN